MPHTQQTPDIYQALEQDHQRMLNLFNDIIAGASKDDCRLGELRDLFLRHKEAEESEFYSLLEGDQQLRPLILQARMEHHGVTILFMETDWTTSDAETWIAKVKVLYEFVRGHIVREQGQIFDGARRVIPAEEARGLSLAFRRKQKAA